MGKSNRTWRCPHALEKAHQDLTDLLCEVNERPIGSLKDSGGREVCRAVERFVVELYRVPGAEDELKRRAGLVANLCAPETPYDEAKAAALKSYRGRPKKLSRSRLVINSLRKSIRNPILLDQVVRERDHLEAILYERVLGLSTNAVAAFQRWLSECIQIQHEAQGLWVDGCNHLYRIHLGTWPEATNGARSGRLLLEMSDFGWGCLLPMRDAADSMIAWLRERPKSEKLVPDDEDSLSKGRRTTKGRREPKQPGRPGRKRVYSPDSDGKLARDWATAKAQGAYKADFAREKGYSLKDFDRLLARVRRRKNRAN